MCTSDAQLIATQSKAFEVGFLIGLSSLYNNFVSVKLFCFSDSGQTRNHKNKPLRFLVYMSVIGCMIGLLGLGATDFNHAD